MKRLPAFLLSLIGIAGCSTHPYGDTDPIALIHIDSARFCDRAVDTYSDFAYIRPGPETIVANANCDRDGMGNGPVVWYGKQATGRWEPPLVVERRFKFHQPFKPNITSVPDRASGLQELLNVALANPIKGLWITPLQGKGETVKRATTRAKAVERWLVKNGVNSSLITINAVQKGSSGVDAEIVSFLEG